MITSSTARSRARERFGAVASDGGAACSPSCSSCVLRSSTTLSVIAPSRRRGGLCRRLVRGPVGNRSLQVFLDVAKLADDPLHRFGVEPLEDGAHQVLAEI